MKNTILFLFTIVLVSTCCEGKESLSNDTEWKNKLTAYNEALQKVPDKAIIDSIKNLLLNLPKDRNELIRARALIEQAGKRNIDDAKQTLDGIVMKGEKSTNKYETGFTPEISMMHYAKESLLRMAENKELLSGGKTTISDKADYIIEKVRRGEKVSSLFQELAPQVTTKLLSLLNDKDDKVRIFILAALENIDSISFQEFQGKIFVIMEQEIRKPNYGLYFYCQRVLALDGNRKAYEFFIKKLADSNPTIRKYSVDALVNLWKRKIISENELKNTVVPLLKDKNNAVAISVRSSLISEGLMSNK